MLRRSGPQHTLQLRQIWFSLSKEWIQLWLTIEAVDYDPRMSGNWPFDPLSQDP